MNWPTVVASLIAAVLGGGGSVAIINAFARRNVTKVEAADRLNESTLEWAERLKADAMSAREEAAGARLEMAAVRREAEALAWDLRRLRLAILDPYATLERLRLMVHGSDNGSGTSLSQPT